MVKNPDSVFTPTELDEQPTSFFSPSKGFISEIGLFILGEPGTPAESGPLDMFKALPWVAFVVVSKLIGLKRINGAARAAGEKELCPPS